MIAKNSGNYTPDVDSVHDLAPGARDLLGGSARRASDGAQAAPQGARGFRWFITPAGYLGDVTPEHAALLACQVRDELVQLLPVYGSAVNEQQEWSVFDALDGRI